MPKFDGRETTGESEAHTHWPLSRLKSTLCTLIILSVLFVAADAMGLGFFVHPLESPLPQHTCLVWRCARVPVRRGDVPEHSLISVMRFSV